MIVLGIESSCDESAAALVDAQRGILSNVVKSQIERHAYFGGVVPEIASRLHAEALAPAVREALARAGVGLGEVDLIAASHRPGLVGCLLVGTTLAKSLAYLLNKPLILVDHLLGHLLAPGLESTMHYPCIAGVFSGGHCSIYFGQGPLAWTLIARTRDDAPGESFDKVAQLMGLAYPGGPALQRFAEGGNDRGFELPSPLPDSTDGDFSFSGLKTAVLYHLRGLQGRPPCPRERWPDLAASFERVVAEALSLRLVQCARAQGARWIYAGGGVAANRRLRNTLQALAAREGLEAVFPALGLCTDNGAMIARAGLSQYQAEGASDFAEDVASRSELGFA